jgi:hypothetical protein
MMIPLPPVLVASDYACLTEIRDVLARHQALDRFGVHLLHHPLPLREREVMLESVDPETRSLKIEIVDASAESLFSSLPKAWKLSHGSTVASCIHRFSQSPST